MATNYIELYEKYVNERSPEHLVRLSHIYLADLRQLFLYETYLHVTLAEVEADLLRYLHAKDEKNDHTYDRDYMLYLAFVKIAIITLHRKVMREIKVKCNIVDE